MNTATLKTTEFVLTFITAAGAIAASVAGVLPEKYSALAASVSVGAYAISRGLSKVFGVVTPPTPVTTTVQVPVPVVPAALVDAIKNLATVAASSPAATPTETEPTA